MVMMMRLKTMMKKKTMVVLDFRFEMRKKIEDVEDNGMKKKMKKMMMMKKISTNFQKGHKTYRDFQKGHNFWWGKIVHLVKVKGLFDFDLQIWTVVSNLQKRANFIGVIWSL